MTEKRFKWDICDGDALFYEDNAVIDYDDVVDLLNQLNKEVEQRKQESDLLRKGLKNYEDTLPLFLTCGEISAFRGKLIDFEIEKMKFYNKNPNLCKIRINGKLIE